MPVLPPHPSLEHLKKQAKQLLKDQKAGQKEAGLRFHIGLPRLNKYGLNEVSSLQVTLQEVQHVIACEYGLPGWTHLVGDVT